MASESRFFKSLAKDEFEIVMRNMKYVPADERFFDFYESDSAVILGEHYFQEKNLPKAIDFYEKALSLYRENFPAERVFNNDAFKELAENAKLNYYNAMYDLAKCYTMIVPPNYEKALAYLKKSAEESEDADAQNALGSMYSEGRGVAQDFAKAAEYFERSAIQGNMYAQNSLGRIYEMGFGREKDLSKAFYWYKQASEQGDDLATENLMRLQGADIPYMGSYEIPGTTVKPAEVMDKIKTDAEQGDFEKQCIIASSYLQGILVPKDEKKVIELLTKYAEEGNPLAQYELGACYNSGLFVKRDNKKAFQYFLNAARQGHVSAKYNVGMAYYYGTVVNQNVRKSFQWLLSAAEDGHPDAQFRIGAYYSFECGCKFDKDAAAYWTERAAEQGHYQAQAILIILCKQGFFSWNPFVDDSAMLKKWTERIKDNTADNMGYSNPIIKLGAIPDINDFDEDDENYSMPETLIRNFLPMFALPQTTAKKHSAHSKAKKTKKSKRRQR